MAYERLKSNMSNNTTTTSNSATTTTTTTSATINTSNKVVKVMVPPVFAPSYHYASYAKNDQPTAFMYYPCYKMTSSSAIPPVLNNTLANLMAVTPMVCNDDHRMITTKITTS